MSPCLPIPSLASPQPPALRPRGVVFSAAESVKAERRALMEESIQDDDTDWGGHNPQGGAPV